MDALNTLLDKTLAPFAYRSDGKADFFGNGAVFLSLGGHKHDLGTPNQAMWHRVGIGQGLNLLMFLFTKNYSSFGSSPWHGYPPFSLQEYTTFQRISKVIYGTLH